MISQFSNVPSPLTDDPVLVKTLFRERDVISSKLCEFAKGKSQWFGTSGEVNLACGTLQAPVHFVCSLPIESLSEFLLAPGALLYQSIHELRFVSIALGNFQAPQRGDFHIQIPYAPSLLAHPRE